MSTLRDDEVDANFEAFQRMLPDILPAHRGEYAVMRHARVEGYHSSLRAALVAASQFPDRLFSIQEVVDRPADLGLFSHAVSSRLA